MRRTILFTIPLLVLLLAMPPAAADRLGASDVTYFAAGPPEVRLGLGERTTFPFVLFNGGTASVFVNLTADGSDVGLGALAPAPFLILEGGQDGRIDLDLIAPQEGAAKSGFVRVRLFAVRLDSGVTFTQDVDVRVTLLGLIPGQDPTGKVLGVWPNPLPPPLDNRWAALGVSLGIWAVIALGLMFVLYPVVRSFANRTATRIDDIVLRILRGPVFATVLLYGAVNSLSILGLPPGSQRLLLSVYGFAFILLLTWVAYRVFRDVLVHYGKQLAARTKSNVDERLIPGLEKLGAVVIVILGLVLAVQSLGYDITLFLAGLGVIGLVVAFAAQDTLSNLFAGVHIMLDRPFRVGDLIEIEDGVICRVEDIGLRSTKLYWGKSHDIIVMPNRVLAERKIINYVRPDRRFRINAKVGVAYDSDLDKVRRVMTEAALAHPWVLKEPGYTPIWRVVDFADSAILVMIIVWVDDVDHQWQLASDLRERIKKRFDEEGVEIPFPQRIVKIRGGESGPTP